MIEKKKICKTPGCGGEMLIGSFYCASCVYAIRNGNLPNAIHFTAGVECLTAGCTNLPSVGCSHCLKCIEKMNMDKWFCDKADIKKQVPPIPPTAAKTVSRVYPEITLEDFLSPVLIGRLEKRATASCRSLVHEIIFIIREALRAEIFAEEVKEGTR